MRTASDSASASHDNAYEGANPGVPAARGEVALDPQRIASLRDLERALAERRGAILDILTNVSDYAAAQSEIESSARSLCGALASVSSRRPPHVPRMAVFMPSNVLLYSYVLYLAIPSLYVNEIAFRPSAHVTPELVALDALLGSAHRLPLHCHPVSQREFIEEQVGRADVVVFTGTYQNGEKVRTKLRKEQLLLFFGQGINPFVVTDKGDVDAAAEGCVRVRMFNTGQDCLGPDVVFVHEAVAPAFLDALKARLCGLRFGERKDPDADYGPIFYSSTVEHLSQYLHSHRHLIMHGGRIDFSLQRIEPTILMSRMETMPKVVEFFGPVFNVVLYEDEALLREQLVCSFFRERALGATVYGSEQLATFLRTHHMVSLNETLLDIEDGNAPFGGYGRMANYAWHQGRLTVAPILITQMVADLLG